VLRANPDARGVLLERADVLAGAAATLEPAGVAQRCELVAGDFLDAVPDSGDLYVLSNILHDWDDDAAARILGACRRAMRPEARLLIVELVLPDGTDPSWAKLLDLEMLAVTPGGRQRTASQYAALLARANLRQTTVVTATADQPASYVEATPIA
jgi:SAM-dependent methyltransferase